jgi:putative endonuclease
MSEKINFGKAGEERAAKYLESNDYKIVERNFRCHFGEIDIIAFKDGTMCFIEVKTRHNTYYGRPSEAVNHKKQIHIRKTADYYLLSHKSLFSHSPVQPDIRFDIIEIIDWNCFEAVEMVHIKNAF